MLLARLTGARRRAPRGKFWDYLAYRVGHVGPGFAAFCGTTCLLNEREGEGSVPRAHGDACAVATRRSFSPPFSADRGASRGPNPARIHCAAVSQPPADWVLADTVRLVVHPLHHHREGRRFRQRDGKDFMVRLSLRKGFRGTESTSSRTPSIGQTGGSQAIWVRRQVGSEKVKACSRSTGRSTIESPSLLRVPLGPGLFLHSHSALRQFAPIEP